jgi:tetratricopeptide (TPR) repeat protein
MEQPSTGELYLIEINAIKNTKFHEVFWKKCNEQGLDICHINHSSALHKKVVEKSLPSAIVMNWNETTTPHVYLEYIAQNPVLSQAPLVMYAGECSQEDIDFWQEYRIKYIVRHTANFVRDSDALLKFVDDDKKNLNRVASESREYRFFFNRLQNNHIDQAKINLKRIESLFNKYDVYYIKAHLLKAEKKFKEAISILGLGLNQAKQEGLQLDARYLHLIGNISFKAKDYERASKFLEAAQRISPKSPRRKLILGQVSKKLGHFEKAREYFIALYKQSSDYDAVLIPLIEYIIDHSHLPENILLLPDLLIKLSERKLLSITKRYNISKHQSYAELVDVFCTPLYRAAQSLIDKDDFYGAVSIYQFARTIIKPIDVDRRFEVNLLIVEALIESNDLLLAQKYLGKLAEPFEHIKSLKLRERYLAVTNQLKAAS